MKRFISIVCVLMLVLASSGNAMAGTNNPTKIVIKEKKFAKEYSDEALLDLAEDGIVVKEAHVKVERPLDIPHQDLSIV